MAWERGYYYWVHKVNGRVVREYVGAGRVAELTAELDASEREQRRLGALARRDTMAALDDLAAGPEALVQWADLLTRAALVAAGYRQHKRRNGENDAWASN
jgi:hypothetical protein